MSIGRHLWPRARICSAMRHASKRVLEPRHATWLAAEVMLQDFEIGRVAADPAVIETGGVPGGWRGVSYWRLHGSPRIYHSAYGPERLQAFAQALVQATNAGIPTGCIFDNTASGHATPDALSLFGLYSQHFQA